MTPIDSFTVASVLLGSVVLTFFRYGALSGGIYLWLCRSKRVEAWPRDLGGPRPTRHQLGRDLYWGSWSCVVMGILGGAVTLWVMGGQSPMYFSLEERGAGYCLLSFFALVFLHDAWFFWTHYLMHRWRWLYRKVHAVHHSSRYPSPFADLSFHPVEALVQAMFVPLCIALFPLHPATVGVYLFFVSVMNAIGHTGYEFFTRPLSRVPVLRHISSTGSHAIHHLSPDSNLGLYLNVWDRMMGSRKSPENWDFASRG